MILITKEYLLQAGYEYDTITYAKADIWLAPCNDGWHVFLNGLQGGVTYTIKYIAELVALEASRKNYERNERIKPEVILPLERLPELFKKYK